MRESDGPQPLTLFKVLAYAGTGIVALTLATLHPLGILLGATAWGLLAPTRRRGVVYGLSFGVIVLVAFAVRLYVEGSLGAVLEASPLVVVPVVIAIAFGVIGGLARGLR